MSSENSNILPTTVQKSRVCAFYQNAAIATKPSPCFTANTTFFLIDRHIRRLLRRLRGSLIKYLKDAVRHRTRACQASEVPPCILRHRSLPIQRCRKERAGLYRYKDLGIEGCKLSRQTGMGDAKAMRMKVAAALAG